MNRQQWELCYVSSSNALEISDSAPIHYSQPVPSYLTTILQRNSLTSFFQPIFCSRSGEVFGYEALARPVVGPIGANGKSLDIERMFQDAEKCGRLAQLDVLCRETALRESLRHGLQETGNALFLNICPLVLSDPIHQAETTDALIEELGLSKDRLVLELTEAVAVQDYNRFRMAVAYYRDQGYKIAIDDFGVGYGGLKMLSMIEPDFVKIDRHFVSNIDRASVRYNLVDMIATACHRMGIHVVAEGVERPEELQVLLDMGIELLQGYHLAPPAPELLRKPCRLSDPTPITISDSEEGELKYIGQIAKAVPPVEPTTVLDDVFKRFIDDPSLNSLPVVERSRVLGLLHRQEFLEKEFLGRFGYARLLNSNKAAIDLESAHHFIAVEANTTLEEVAQRVSMRHASMVYEDICVTQNGRYLGVVSMSALLEAMTQRSILLAQGANPLTKLPGNEHIQREIETRIMQNTHFNVCYIDLDQFKPYNDHYGFARGDAVLKRLAQLLQESVSELGHSATDFVGHIGGDDFIVLCRPQVSLPLAEALCEKFMSCAEEFHGPEDSRRGFYVGRNRSGEIQEIGLLSLSVAIVSSEINRIDSFAQLASLAAEIKLAAKMQAGNSIVCDRRLGVDNGSLHATNLQLIAGGGEEKTILGFASP